LVDADHVTLELLAPTRCGLQLGNSVHEVDGRGSRFHAPSVEAQESPGNAKIDVRGPQTLAPAMETPA
jgi:hypothetical protein